MSTDVKICYAVCTRAGRLLALAPKQTLRSADGRECGWRPVPQSGQMVVEVELTAEHAGFALHEILEQFAIDLQARGGARLRRQAELSRQKSRRRKK